MATVLARALVLTEMSAQRLEHWMSPFVWRPLVLKRLLAAVSVLAVLDTVVAGQRLRRECR